VVAGVSAVEVAADPVVPVVDEGSAFVAVAPLRVLDTRSGIGNGGQAGPVAAGVFLDLSAYVPSSATAVVVNLTGTQPSAATTVLAAPSNANVADTANLSLVAGETRAGQATVALPRTGERRIYLANGSGSVHLIVDLEGYYTTDTASRFTPTPPARVLDTRTSSPIGPASTVQVDLSGRVPATATSVTFNLTGTSPSVSTYVTAYPSGATRPTASSLNLAAAQTTPNLITVPLGTDRRVTLYNAFGSVHVIVDLAGYYATDRGDRFFPMTPARVLDTRSAGGALGPGSTRDVGLAGRIAATASAAAVTVTGTGTTTSTYVTAYPAGASRPLASTVNLLPQRDTTNSAAVALGDGARMTLYNHSGSTQLLVDIAGFFANPIPCTHDCLYGWGGDLRYGLTPARRPWLSGITSVDASYHTAYALRGDGTVWAWGDNQYGQLGAGSTGGSSTVPLQVTGLTDVTAVVAGTWAGYALRSDGRVWAWGSNNAGQLGFDASSNNSDVPIQVAFLGSVTAIAASNQAAYALRSDGSVWTWGDTGSSSGDIVPHRVALPLPDNTRITAIAASLSDTIFALRSDGTIWAWGSNNRGQTGTGSTSYLVRTPAQVVGLTNAVAIFAGTGNGYAVTADGNVWAWGDNTSGNLGNGSRCPDPDLTTCKSTIPVQVSGLTDVVTIDSVHSTTIAARTDGTVWTWGRNDDQGNLGNGPSCDSVCHQRTPTPASITGVSDIAAGGLGHFAVVPD
jgi:alpha-tubulin suppressor-like RCC1 family protein